MKLLIENWRRFLLKESKGKTKEFYHATLFPVESFVKGIDATKAKGFGQGAGFFVFINKQDAIEHAGGLVSGGMEKQIKYTGANPVPKIVIIDPPLTPENFDIDYEVSAKVLIDFIIKNPEAFSNIEGFSKKHNKKFEIRKISSKFGIVQFHSKPDKSSRMSIRDTGTGNAQFLSDFAKQFSISNPELFRQFEEQVLSQLDTEAIKYNGKEKIIPLRIEDLQGKVLWSRS